MNAVLRRLRSLTHPSSERALILCAIVSLGAFMAVRFVLQDRNQVGTQVRIAASKHMERAISVLREAYKSRGLQFDDGLDPQHTGLIGVEYSDMVTTLGSIEAKRTTTNSNMAGLIVQLLEEAGVVPGDTIAVGCSGSFPALAVATLSATHAMGVHPVMILSLGSSSFGANRTDWTLLEITDVLKESALVTVSPAAVSLGGADDAGNDLEAETRALLSAKIGSSGIPFLHHSDLPRIVAERMRIYLGPTGLTKIAAFVNIGGSYADLGTDPLALKLEPGLNRQITMPKREEQYGVVFAMAKRHIPVIHLLHIKGLVLKYGFPWDPTPLPRAGGEAFVQAHSVASLSFLVLFIFYFGLITAILVAHRREFIRISL